MEKGDERIEKLLVDVNNNSNLDHIDLFFD
jgi:hypothetical protein